MTDAATSEDARLPPLSVEEYGRLLRELGAEPVAESAVRLNVTRMWAHSPRLMLAQQPLQRYLRFDSPLTPRVREVATLRIGWRCSAPYEVMQHVEFALTQGLSESEIAALFQEDVGTGWSPAEAAAIRATDELHALHTVTGSTWEALSAHFSPAEIVDLLSLVGRYWTVSVVSNAVRLQPEPGAAFSDLPGAPTAHGGAP
ncbi:carboxymuconolactone decarboxylase family protein [Microbacterium album]|uniref:Carboxymuconolactone decarboxylase-like domain-containing protein n=1 Tax=Microbacterium album TaxID=2053191 RepID=A0A917IFI7_9MICO|nr:carboxymuconolactone decarboxylase family protein [Microbacterium album]GGH48426.1 hypothetical protein GCM10010921_25880 [Microbacterium album]